MNSSKNTSENNAINSTYKYSSVWRLYSGLISGSVSTVLLHPFDVAKTRLQVNEGTGIVSKRPKSHRMLGTLAEVYRARGIAGCYQGVAPNLIGSSSSWGLYFYFYDALKKQWQGGDTSKPLSSFQYFYISTIAGASTQLLVNPIWVVKTRFILHYETLSTSQRPSVYRLFLDTYRNEGVRGLYKGLTMSMLSVSNGAIQFMLYEKMKNYINADIYNRPIESKMSNWQYVLISFTSKSIATIATYPLQLTRSRLQDQHRMYTSYLHIWRELLQNEGMIGFYKGLWPSIMRNGPACVITFLVYENLNNRQ